MKTIKPLLLSLVILSACSNERPIDKQAIIQAYKDSVTLDSLRMSKVKTSREVKKNRLEVTAIDTPLVLSNRSYTDKEYSKMLAYKEFFEYVSDTRAYNHLDVSVTDSMQVSYDECLAHLSLINKSEVKLDKIVFDRFYNDLLEKYGTYIESQ